MTTQKVGKPNWGLIVAVGGLAVAFIGACIGAAMFIGGLTSDVKALDKRTTALETPEALKASTKVATDAVAAAGKAASDNLKANAVGFIGPINTLICIQANVGCQLVPANDPNLDLVQDIPVDRKLLGAWVVPVENLPDTAAFNHLDASVIDRKTIRVRAVPRSSFGQLRVFVYAVYGPM
jgi:hypothetical protein